MSLFDLRRHPAVFGDVTLYLTFVLELGGGSDFRSVAHRLLKAGLAETVASPAQDEVRVAPRYRKLISTRRKAELLADLDKVRQQGLKSFLRWSVRHPVWAARILSRVFIGLFVSRSPQDGSTNTEEEESLSARMEETARFIDQSVANSQMFLAIQTRMDRDLFIPGYLESEPYLRLKLRSFRGTLESTPETSTQEDDVVGFDVSLLLHRSGVALLSMRAELPSGRQADQLIPMLAGDWLRLKQAILPEPVVKFASRGWGVSNQAWEGTWSDDVEEGIRWLHSVGSSFTDVFRAYQEAIVWSARIRDPGSDWLCYPTLLIDSPACCGSESRWRRRHLRELVGIAARYAPYRSIPVAELDRLLGARHVLMGGDLLLINEGMATQLHWAFDGSRQLTIADELSRLALSEHVLLQYWQLRLLDRTLDATEQRQRELLNAERQVIYGLEEYRHSRLSYGTAREIVDSFKARFGIGRVAWPFRSAIEVIASGHVPGGCPEFR
jgi:hypothetical protein